ncbi:MAG: nuclear transport factor 2 family protein [Burkholderiaceae bacterium]|nr:MAG: nuclear transport factor 2 family protein [Burkholderiaceae bacterium]
MSLYKALSAKDMSRFAPFIPEQRFSEINPDWQDVRILDRAVFERIFQSGAEIDFRIEDLQVTLLGDTHGIVTGYRTGTITPPNAAPIASKMPLTMLWYLENGIWKLKHVHLSSQ